MTHCSHRQNPIACLECWKACPVGPDPRPEAQTGTQVAHAPCGCRLSVSYSTGEVISWHPCQAGHDPPERDGRSRAPRERVTAQRFWASVRDLPSLVLHSLAERAECDDERCREAARRVDRARARRGPKPGFGREG